MAFAEVDRLTNTRGPEDSGVSIVISPLISLMKDQVDALARRNVSAACLDSTKTRDQYLQIYDDLRRSDCCTVPPKGLIMRDSSNPSSMYEVECV